MLATNSSQAPDVADIAILYRSYQWSTQRLVLYEVGKRAWQVWRKMSLEIPAAERALCVTVLRNTWRYAQASPVSTALVPDGCNYMYFFVFATHDSTWVTPGHSKALYSGKSAPACPICRDFFHLHGRPGSVMQESQLGLLPEEILATTWLRLMESLMN